MLQTQRPDFGARTIEAQIRASGVTVQIFNEDYPTPVEQVIHEADFTVALQRQPPQHVSNGRYCVAGANRRFDRIGRVLVVPADVPLQIHASGGPVRAVRCSFSPEPLRRYTGQSGLVDPAELKSCLDVQDSVIAGTLARMGEEAMAPGLASNVLTEALGVSLMVEFSRYLQRTRIPAKPSRGGLSQRQLRCLTEFIDGQQASPTIDELACLTGISRRHLSRAFKQTTGQTIHDYVEQIRLNKAMHLLGGSNLLMKDIAFRLGFASACSFSVAFRKSAGETPRGFRRRVRGGAVTC
jgi:AraC family transcriptional regulator